MTTETPETTVAPSKKSLWQSLRPFFTRQVLVMIFLGLSSGLPFTLIFETLSIWLRDEGLSLSTIGYFSLATFSYSLKFVWAPLVDRVGFPILSPLLGHRRGWILAMQAIIVLGLWTISSLNPTQSLGLMAIMAILTGFAGATQDIVIDAWRIETGGESSDGQAVMATAHAWGARTATFLSGIIPLFIAKYAGWGLAYAVMAAMMGLGVAAVLLAPREQEHRVRPIDYNGVDANPMMETLEWVLRGAIMIAAIFVMGCGLTANISMAKPVFQLLDASGALFETVNSVWTSKTKGIFLQFPSVLLGLLVMFLACLPLAGMATRPGAYLRQTFVVPIVDFLGRYQNLAFMIFAMICFYRVSDFLLTINGAFYRDLGFELDVIAEVRKVFGVIMTIVGVSTAGLMLTRLGMKTSLIVGAIVGSLSNLAYAWLATQGNSLTAFSITLAIDNISGGIAGTVLIAYMSSLISQQFAAPQYALFSSLYALPGKLIASQSGVIVEQTAKGADHGGLAAPFLQFMQDLPKDTYVKPASDLAVSVHALGAGYMLFFVYTALMGIVSVILALWLINRPQIQAELDS